MTPQIPFIQIPELTLIDAGALGGGFPPVPVSFKPFGILVALGAYVGSWLAIRQGRRLGFDERSLTSFLIWVAVSGFVLGHVLDTLFYYPERWMRDPLSLLRLWEGLSSFGGFVGALVGGLAWTWHHKARLLPYADVVSSAFPVAWCFGRAGCAVAHDHPGRHSDAWFAVAYPDGGRFDLGLYELLLTLPIAALFLVLRRKPRPWGFYAGTMCVAYAPARFALDFLRSRDLSISDARYASLTPAQWGCFGLLALGAVVLWRALASAGTPEAFAVPPPALEPTVASGADG